MENITFAERDLYDKFAISAMNGLLVVLIDHKDTQDIPTKDLYPGIANESYDIAEAMILERRKRLPTKFEPSESAQ